MTTYSFFDKYADLSSGSGPYTPKAQGIDTADQIGYWRMNEAAGAVAIDLSPQANDGAYTGVTLGETGIGDGETCPLFDGANDFNEIQTAGFGADWDGDEFTVAGWLKVSGAGVLTDGIQHNVITIGGAGGNLYICSAVGNNTFGFRLISGGVDKTSHVTGITSTGWIHMGMTVSAGADEKKVYVNGLQSGATLNGLGTWAGASTLGLIGAGTDTPTALWDGWLAHWLVFKKAISAANMLNLATV